jgi:hydrogenase maturation protein HypF
MVGVGGRSAGDACDEGDMSFLRAVRIHVRGVVQGVGFRPFVYSHAVGVGLNGWVRNTSAGVEIHAEGKPESVEAFLRDLQAAPPPLARIHSFDWEECPPNGFSSFEILASESHEGDFIPISPDMSLCDDCRRELFDPNDRRYRYPFINCTNCGPRFTIITDIPYDRPNTTMAPFEMCADCGGEYHDPLDRRFHAQPVACPVCGPQVWLEEKGARVADSEAAIQAARFHLREGRVVAIKGLGGFHLACDATNSKAVVELRHRKLRVDKPFAVMVPNLEAAQAQAEVSEAEAALLTSRERPILLVERCARSSITPAVAPGQNRLGLMLPYTPLHELILEPEDGYPSVLVMTSGNISEEPIAIDNREALTRLDSLADVFLLHDRDIRTRCDDSVVTELRGELYPLRRSRGFAPYPVQLPWQGPAILAGGPELKNTFCLTQGTNAFISHHIGDLENYETLASFEDGIQQYETLFRVEPERFAYDLHPNYLATRYILARSEREGVPATGVQHHHAHIASCMAENQLPLEAKVIGLAFDGTGYGEDGAIWGGEVLLGGYIEVERVAHLKYIPLPGGDAAIRAPWRMALAWLWASNLAWDDDLPPVSGSNDEERSVLLAQLAQGLNAPPTSSLGRLFDAVAALVGVRQTVNYEAQAAMELEAMVNPSEGGAYSILVRGANIDPAEMFAAIVADLHSKIPVDVIASRFHNAISRMVVELCDQQREAHDLDAVVLSGGVWQNMILLEKSMTMLHENGYTVWVHHQVPANDGGVSLGQAAVVGARQLVGLD